MSRKRRKNKPRKSTDSEESQHMPLVCRCSRKFFKQRKNKEFKDSQKKQVNDHSHPCIFPSEAQTQPQHHDNEDCDIHHQPAKSSATYDNLDSFLKVTWHDTSTMSQYKTEEFQHNTDQAEGPGKFTVTSNGFHLNLEINKGSYPKRRTHVIITNGKSLKKSRSYHDSQHQQSQRNAMHKWDFMEDSGKLTEMETPKHKSCEQPLIKLEIIGEGIEVKYKTVSQNVTVCIESDEVHHKNHDGTSFTQATEYCSTGGSFSSYPMSDSSLNEGKEFCSDYKYSQWYVDIPPPPAEFADEKDTFVNIEDEALLLGDSIKEPYYTSQSSSSWSELETESRQSKDDVSPAERSKNHHYQYLRQWNQCIKEPVKPNKACFTKVPFLSNRELKLHPSNYCHSRKSDCPLNAKVMRRKTFPQIYYDPYVTCSHTRQSFFQMREKLFTSNSMPQGNHPHVSAVDLGRPLVSSSYLSSKDHNIISLEHPMAISCCTQEEMTSIHSNVSGPGENDEHNLDVANRQLNEDEDFNDIMKHAEDRIDFSESGFDEDMLDSDNHTEVQDISKLQSKGFLIQVTPPSRSTSREYILGKNSNSQVPVECLQQSEVNQSNAPETENASKKRRGSVVTVVTGDLDQRVLIQGDIEAPASRSQELSKEFKSSVLQRDSVLTPVSDVEEPDSENKNSSFEDQCALAFKDISLQTSEPFDPFSSMEHQTNIPDEPCIKEENITVYPQLEESNNTSPRNSSDSAIAGTSFESMTFQIPRLTKSDSEENCPKNVGKVEEYLEKVETPIKRNKKDANSETFNKHLKLPKDSVLKELRSCESPQDEGSDRWAKKRKQFKEMKNCNSAGGSSITSNLTEESGNSEETRSVDLTAQSDNKDKGLYTESFHSASWIFRGDDCSPDNSPQCLSKRPRSVAIRERTVRIAKGTGDYPWGFRIQFSKPILVTEVDTNGAAEEAGLQVGDIVMAVNGTDVTSIPHSEAASLARQEKNCSYRTVLAVLTKRVSPMYGPKIGNIHQFFTFDINHGPDVLTLVVGSDISRFPNTPRPTCRGYLHKRTHSGLLKGWRKRWFVLKHDGSLHYYKHKKDEGKCRPLEVTKLEGSEVGVDTSLGKPFVFRCVPQSGNRIFYFCATSNQEMKRWLEAMDKAVHPLNQNHVWVDVTMHNISLPPLAIKNPECLGLLHQLDRNKDTWIEHYCILKDGCLYFYTSIRANNALGGIYLQGYTVSEQSVNSRRCIIELKPPSEEFQTFYLSAGNTAENKRWITALKTSINKWLPLHQAIQDFMSRPLEETRM